MAFPRPYRLNVNANGLENLLGRIVNKLLRIVILSIEQNIEYFLWDMMNHIMAPIPGYFLFGFSHLMQV